MPPGAHLGSWFELRSGSYLGAVLRTFLPRQNAQPRSNTEVAFRAPFNQRRISLHREEKVLVDLRVTQTGKYKPTTSFSMLSCKT